MILSEVWTWCKKSGKKVFIFKIDFEKAYDNVNWGFLLDLMDKMAFPSRWCSWVKGVLESARSAVLVNGSPTFDFECHKGLRQGDPLSPFIFLIIMEAFSRLLDRSCSAGNFKGVQLPNGGPVISHLLYADDALIIGEWSDEIIRMVARILRVFYACSGLKINFQKSNLFGVGVDDGEVSRLASILSCNKGDSPFNYLGIPLGANMNRVKNWDPIISVFKNRLASWKANTLSIGGRVVLIKAVPESLPIYYFSIFKVPIKVVEKLESLMKNFLWGGSGEVRKMHWVAWDCVCRPKKLGGLGFCKLKLVNEALLAKWVWRFRVEEDNIWRRVVVACHSNRRKWSYLPSKASLTGVWKNIANMESKLLVNG
ncbi:putative RNA-directed DNA polymerase [Helianthus annuus]|nr:putative RNA-directed DNA polymerase [Helianthus annuus]KAJ0826708.1 putative RNA-directed DNA polymerase [Helianthus annuus]